MGVVIAFYGADHKCGTSMLVQCFAEYTAQKYKDCNVMLIHTENGECEEYSPNVKESLESIRPYLAEKLIDTSSVMEKSRYKDNLFIIGGASRPGSSNLYHPDMAQYLVAVLSENFDFVICDSGSEIEHAMTLGSLYSADYVYVVTTQDEYCIRRFEWIKPLLEKVNIRLSGVIINKYEEYEVNNVEITALRTGIDEKNVICIRSSKLGRKACQENKTLLAYKDPKFMKDFGKAAELILQRCGQ